MESASQADDRDIAREMVRRYDLVADDPEALKYVHRVSRYLMGSGPGQLGPDFRQWVGEGRMSDRLRSEIAAYQLCVLDDSFVEGPHALIGRIARQASTPSPSWWCSTVRLAQNMQELDRSKVQTPGRFEQLFAKWKLVGQRVQRRYLIGQVPRMSTRPFLRFVYRTGMRETQRDWTVLHALADKPSEGLPETKPGDLDLLSKEYLLAVFVPGSVVEVHDRRGVSALELVSGGEQGASQDALVPVRHFYEVVSRSLVSNKFISTQTAARMKLMRAPLVLQRLTLCDNPGQDLPLTLAAVPEGHPEVQDVRMLGSWQDLRHRLHAWSVETISDDGSLVLSCRTCMGQLAWTFANVMDSQGNGLPQPTKQAPDRQMQQSLRPSRKHQPPTKTKKLTTRKVNQRWTNGRFDCDLAMAKITKLVGLVG